MSIKQDLKRSIKMILRHNREGSYSTKATREKILTHFADDIVTLGYGLRDIRGIKPKHITAIVEHWQKNQLANATIKNRLAALRNICQQINKPGIVQSNDALKIGKRRYISAVNLAVVNPDFSKISNAYIQVSLELQRVFGLRREECIKIKPHLADKGDKLELLASWCKGGRGRTVSIRTDEQRYWLDQAKEQAGKFGYSLIPPNKQYKQQLAVYEKQVQRAGLSRLHGLRHAFAQARYKELTGWDAPINGGPKISQLTPEQKIADHRSRMIITEELGHSRKSVVANYCGP